MKKEINIEAYKNEGFTYNEIESIKRGLDDVENARVIPYSKVKVLAREKIFSKENIYV
ncbi:MAG: hypothetical protein Q8K30_04795 [Candidatus Gracilibacteria bacterium]|nr:hypothetical protein [Candidatus Gracilibacteria bacterium]